MFDAEPEAQLCDIGESEFIGFQITSERTLEALDPGEQCPLCRAIDQGTYELLLRVFRNQKGLFLLPVEEKSLALMIPFKVSHELSAND